ncbi:MAG: DinB family protein [Bacteroidetes bacterium]|nr:DinB family protein [Bacteroidota bacterium]
MLTENLATLFERDILKLKAEISLYTDEALLWETLPGTSNSGGNLCLHLLGNLQYYIGAVLGGSRYVRNRPEEFNSKNLPLVDIRQQLDQVAVLIPKTLRSLSAETLETEYPEKVFDYPMTTQYFMIHLLAHFDYHLGQINYHRRLVSNS